MVKVARRAEAAVPTGGTAQTKGIAVHKQFDRAVSNGDAGRNVHGEAPFVGGKLRSGYRPKGSSNPDAIVGKNLDNPVAVFDLKTGKSGLSPSQAKRYEKNLPDGTPVFELRSSGHTAPRPRTGKGVGLGGNLLYQGSGAHSGSGAGK